MIPVYQTDVIALLQLLGVELSLDWDNDLIYEIPAHLPNFYELSQFVWERRQAIVHQLKFLAEQDRAVFYGGSLNGQRVPFRCSIYIHNVSRGIWEAYCAMDGLRDRRMIFLSQETSKKKAIQIAKSEYERRLNQNR